MEALTTSGMGQEQAPSASSKPKAKGGKSVPMTYETLPKLPDGNINFSVVTTDQLQSIAADLNLEKRAIEAAADANEAKTKEIEPVLLERMVDNSSPRVTVKGITIHVRREIWASTKFAPKLRAWLRRYEPESAAIVKETANAQTLSAFVREKIAMRKAELGEKSIGKKTEDLLPAGLLKLLNISEQIKIGYRK